MVGVASMLVVPGALAVLLPLLISPPSWLVATAGCLPHLSSGPDGADEIPIVSVTDPSELDRWSKALKGSCYPYVLRLEFLADTQWTPELLSLAPEPWAITRDTPIIELDKTRRPSHSGPAESGEYPSSSINDGPAESMPLKAWFALPEAERARYYARASSSRYDNLGFGDDLRLIFGVRAAGSSAAGPPTLAESRFWGKPAVCHELFDFSDADPQRAKGRPPADDSYLATLRLSGKGNAWVIT